jgi:hypothetical protein
VTAVYGVSLAVAAIALILWGARNLDRYETRLELEDLAGEDDWTMPQFRRPRDVRVFVDQLEEIRSLPEVAA